MIKIGKDVIIEPGAIITALFGKIGDRSIIRSGARIEGNCVELGTESYLDYNAWIGGGSCFDKCAFLKTGDWFHMGWNSQVNIARGVTTGHEVGIGIETKIFTHGAYLPHDMGFPVQWAPVFIGSRVWLPNAIVHPGVTIADNVVVAAGSVVTRDLPPGCFAGGIPAKILEIHKYPKKQPLDINMCKHIDTDIPIIVMSDSICVNPGAGKTIFDTEKREIHGPANAVTELVKNQLRRNGIRFRYMVKGGQYVPWE